MISIEYIDQFEIVRLKENENYGKFIEYGGKEEYKISPYAKKLGNKIEINLEIFSGDAVLQFNKEIKEKAKYLFYGSTEKYIFNETSLAGQTIFFSVIARKNTYYVISYRHIDIEIDEVNIGESGLLLQFIEGNQDAKKYFHFQNINSKEYIINFIPINCEIEVYFENLGVEIRKINPYFNGQFEILGSNSYDNQIIKYYVLFNQFKFNQPSDNYCIFYVGYSESSKEIPTLLRENIPYVRTTLNNKNSFVWPFPYIKGDIDIKINFENNITLKTEIYINDNDQSINNVISRSALLDISSDYLNICKNITGCPILLNIELESEYLLDNQFEISLSSPKKTPFHLQKNMFKTIGVNDNQTNYYYYDIGKNEKGEIILDFKRGSGIIFAKIVNKNSSIQNENAWAKKVILPTENDYDKELIYDPYTQTIKYNKYITKKCINDCFIVFGVKSKEDYSEYQNLFTFEYSITPFYKFIEENPYEYIYIPMNEFIFGTLSSPEYQRKYKFKIVDRLKGIEIEFNSEGSDFRLIYGKGFDYNVEVSIENKKNPQLIRLISGQQFNGIQLPSFENKQFIIIIDKQEYESGIFTSFFFRIRPIYNNRPNIIELNSDKETTCQIEKGKCYFIVPLYSYDNISSLILYADTEGINDVIFYTRVIDTKTYDSCTEYNCYEDLLADDDSKSKSSKTQNNTKFISLNKNELNRNNYIMVTVTSNTNKFVSVVSAFKSFSKSTIPTINNIQLIYVKKGNYIDISLDGYVFNFTLIHITGNGKYQIEEDKDNEKNIQTNEPEIIESKGINKNIKFKF